MEDHELEGLLVVVRGREDLAAAAFGWDQGLARQDLRADQRAGVRIEGDDADGVRRRLLLDDRRFGLESAHAPDLYVRSSSFPNDLEVEVAGTDGIVWLRGGMAERTQMAPLFVRVGRQAYSIGVESGLRSEWLEVYPALAGELVGAVNRGARGVARGDDSWMLLESSLKAREWAYASTRSRRIESLED